MPRIGRPSSLQEAVHSGLRSGRRGRWLIAAGRRGRLTAALRHGLTLSRRSRSISLRRRLIPRSRHTPLRWGALRRDARHRRIARPALAWILPLSLAPGASLRVALTRNRWSRTDRSGSCRRTAAHCGARRESPGRCGACRRYRAARIACAETGGPQTETRTATAEAAGPP